MKAIVNKNFRHDINALRALAVIVVVFFHFRIDLLDSGFIGVDIFFVISGYLMTSIIFSKLLNNQFSHFDFYFARAVRIVPALLFVCLVLLVLGYFLLLPSEYRVLGKHTIASLSFLSNIIYFSESGYFDVSSHKKWLLHTWSLSVEWQFYLLYPFLLASLYRLIGAVKTPYIIAIVVLGSFFYCAFYSQFNQSSTYFLLQFRFWELGFGGIVYFVAQSNSLKINSRVVNLLGLTLLLLSCILLNEDNWPGYKALLPVLGTGLVILANNQTFYLYKNKAVSLLGKSSYSIYLWHWPIAVFIFQYIANTSYLVVFIALVMSMLLGVLSYKFVEIPIQDYFVTRKRNKLNFIHNTAPLTLSLLAVCLFSVAAYLSFGFPSRVSQQVKIADFERFNQETSETKSIAKIKDLFAASDVILIGDSFAAAVSTSIQGVVEEHNQVFSKAVLRGCKTVLNIEVKNQLATRKCTKWYDELHHALITLPPKSPSRKLIFVNSLSFPDNLYIVRDDEINKAAEASIKNNYVDSLCKLQTHFNVSFMLPIPQFGFDVPTAVARAIFYQEKSDSPVIKLDYHKESNRLGYEIGRLAAQTCGVNLLEPTDYLCPNDLCLSAINSRPLYYDPTHLSLYGAEVINPVYSKLWKFN
ncbi:MAG: acyltransferase family protein [Thalassotalea sp.]